MGRPPRPDGHFGYNFAFLYLPSYRALIAHLKDSS